MLDLAAGNLAVERELLLVRRTCTLPIPGQAPQGHAPRERAASWHLACAAVAWLAESCMAEERRPLCWNVRESVPCHVWAAKCPRQQLVSCSIYFLQHSKRVWSLPPARPTASLIHTVSQPVFSGAGTNFFRFRRLVSSWKLAKEKKKWLALFCIYGLD